MMVITTDICLPVVILFLSMSFCSNTSLTIFKRWLVPSHHMPPDTSLSRCSGHVPLGGYPESHCCLTLLFEVYFGVQQGQIRLPGVARFGLMLMITDIWDDRACTAIVSLLPVQNIYCSLPGCLWSAIFLNLFKAMVELFWNTSWGPDWTVFWAAVSPRATS